MKQYTPENITELKENEIFVFGSNRQGRHAGGAAKFAADNFGAVNGVGEGITGKSYALPTLDFDREDNKLSYDELCGSFQKFVDLAEAYPHNKFLLTAVGTGIAGYKLDFVRNAFHSAYKGQANIIYPKSFETTIKGYKVFNPDFSCRGMKYGIGEFKMEDSPIACERGYHFCIKASHCFSYYSFDPNNIVCEVEAIGEWVSHQDDSKIATNHLRVIRQLEWHEVLRVSNEGCNNVGHSNTGYSNTGNRNTGNSNTGNSNTGYSNTGNSNTGNSNTGNSNTGNSNTGYSNTGNSNTGNSNTGNSNTGNSNTGNSNTGNSNTGNSNTGNSNTGYSNTGNRNTGAFGNKDAPFTLFNKKTSWTEQDFLNSDAYRLIRSVDANLWVPSFKMTEEEKSIHIGWERVGGFYRDIPYKEAFSNAWGNWSIKNRTAFTSLPNFNPKIFLEITGVDVNLK